MSLISIKLPNGAWQFDETDRLGPPGGFGEVFRGQGQVGEVAVKRLKIEATQAAHRELDIGRNLMARDLAHVVPVFDAGQDAESERYYLIMPVCKESLQDFIDRCQGSLDIQSAKTAILAIIDGLLEVGDIVHRDLKPSNVLLHEGEWKVADFGIAKFVDESTAIETVRGFLTGFYAAPEQWRGERPTNATDVYALGCIIHTLILGRPPFSGSLSELMEQHLHAVAPQLTGVSARISALVAHMLRKPAASRPSLARCADLLSGEFSERPNPNSIFTLLSRVGREVAEQEARVEAEQLLKQAKFSAREAQLLDARNYLWDLCHRLASLVIEHAPSSEFKAGKLKLGRGVINFNPQVSKTYIENPFEPNLKLSGWDVLCFSTISASQWDKNFRVCEYRHQALLIFADIGKGDGYRWYEMGLYGDSANNKFEPFAVYVNTPEEVDHLDQAIHNTKKNSTSRKARRIAVAYGPIAIDAENEERFFEGWSSHLALASSGMFAGPRKMPIQSQLNI